MAKAMLSLQVQPYRMLKKADAAAYCGLPAAASKCSAPCRPSPIPTARACGTCATSTSWVDSLKTGAIDSDDTILEKLG